MYPEELCTPMREDLTSVGFIEMKDSDKAKKLLDKVLESNPNSLQKEQALSLLKKID